MPTLLVTLECACQSEQAFVQLAVVLASLPLSACHLGNMAEGGPLAYFSQNAAE